MSLGDRGALNAPIQDGFGGHLGVQPGLDMATLGLLPPGFTYLGDTGGSRGPPGLGGEVGDGGRSLRIHGGQERPHRAVLHHEGLAAGAAGGSGGRGSGSRGVSRGGRGQVTPLQLCRQARGLPHHLFQTGPAQGTPAPTAAPVSAPPARPILILLFLLAADAAGEKRKEVSALNATAKKWQEPPPPCHPGPHSLGDTSSRTPRMPSMMGACPQDPQDPVHRVIYPLGPHLWGAMYLRPPTMS